MKQPSISAYPNPATEYFHLGFNDFISQSQNIVVYDVLGREVFKKQRLNSGDVESINTSNFGNGLFTVIVFSESGGRVAKQVLVNK